MIDKHSPEWVVLKAYLRERRAGLVDTLLGTQEINSLFVLKGRINELDELVTSVEGEQSP